MYTIHYGRTVDSPFLCGKVKVPGEDLRRSLPHHEVDIIEPGHGKELNTLLGLKWCEQCCLKLCLLQVDRTEI